MDEHMEERQPLLVDRKDGGDSYAPMTPLGVDKRHGGPEDDSFGIHELVYAANSFCAVCSRFCVRARRVHDNDTYTVLTPMSCLLAGPQARLVDNVAC